VNYVSWLASKPRSYSVVTTHKVAILQTLMACGNMTLVDSVLIPRVMKGIFNSNPPKPRYTCTWDTSILLRYLRSLYPLASLSLKLLTFKVVSLVALVSAQRAQTLLALDIKFMKVEPDKIVFNIDSLLKGTRPGRPNAPLELSSFVEHELCVHKTMLHYVERTRLFRKSTKLFVSFKTGQPVCTSTLARWIKDTMELSGVDVTIFKAHSLRGAAASTAWRKGVQLTDIFASASWAKERTFIDLYRREVSSDEPSSDPRTRFARAVLL
jgi:hypothetical protein